MTVLGPVLALALAGLPYPAPRLIQPTAATKCDRATVVSVDAAKRVMKGMTKAGLVTYQIGPDVQVFDKAGKPAGAPTALTQGTEILVYYVVDDGAKVQEIDLR